MGLFLKGYLYQTEDTDVRSWVTEYFTRNNTQDPYSKALAMKHLSQSKTLGEGEAARVRYNYQDRYFDENIDLSRLMDIAPYEGFNVRTFASHWATVVLKDMESDQPASAPEMMLVGGDTNAMSLVFGREEGIELADFADVVDDMVSKGWQGYDVTEHGVYREAAFDRVVLLLQKSDAELHVTTYYYRADKCTMYYAAYAMYYSALSMTYGVREQIFKQIVLVSTLVYHD